MKHIAIIWRESVYKNDFKCNKCGHKCAYKNGKVADDVLCDGVYLFCGDCKNRIATIEEMDTSLKPGLHGDINEYRKKTMS